MIHQTFKIAIDGPAGSGKSSIAKYFAKKHPEFVYINTGLMFRALAYYLVVNKLEIEAIDNLLDNHKLKINLKPELLELYDEKQKYELQEKDLKDLKVADVASYIANNPKVRQFLKIQQQEIAAAQNVIMDGRDIGTIVLPNAQVKIYLTADSKIRAQRRIDELKYSSIPTSLSFDEVHAQILDRDQRDKERIIAPLKKADDAIEINSNNLDIHKVYELIEALYLSRK